MLPRGRHDNGALEINAEAFRSLKAKISSSDYANPFPGL